MQQNNQDMTGFQNSMRKNSWQKPKSLYEMNGGGHVNQGDFDARDRMQEPARRADEEGLKAIRSDLKDIASKAHAEWLVNDGTGHPSDSVGEAESNDYLREHPSWRNLSDSARDDVRRDFMAHLSDIHDSHMSMLDQDEEDMRTDALEKQGRYESYNRLNEVKANIRGEYPRTVYSADQDPTASPSGASFDKRKLIAYAAEAALKDPNHWIHDPKHHNIRRALFNFTNENTQTEDLPHIVAFTKQDPKFIRDLKQLDADIEKYGHF